jgi:hypothetical protein
MLFEKYYFCEIVGVFVDEETFKAEHQKKLSKINPNFVFEINPLYESWTLVEILGGGKVRMRNNKDLTESLFIPSPCGKGYIPLYEIYPYPL